MLPVVTQEQKMENRRNFVKIYPGTLFSFSIVKERFVVHNRYCIAVRKISYKVWEVIELTKENTERLVAKRVPVFSKVALKDMRCLNIIKLLVNE
jgi:hypothetical protein